MLSLGNTGEINGRGLSNQTEEALLLHFHGERLSPKELSRKQLWKGIHIRSRRRKQHAVELKASEDL